MRGASVVLAVPLVLCSAQTEQTEQVYTVASEELPCVDEAMREKLRSLMLHALDKALEEQIAHVFSVWMRDAHGQPARARLGSKQALIAYVHARQAALAWTPMVCGALP